MVYNKSYKDVIIFTPFSRVNLLVLFRLKNQFFELCEDMEQDSLKCSEMKSLCLEFHIFCKKRFQIGCGIAEKIAKYAFCKQANKQVNQQEISITRHCRDF
ncbi:hypothetical protein ACKWTF_004997 [Chironomus riparius]